MVNNVAIGDIMKSVETVRKVRKELELSKKGYKLFRVFLSTRIGFTSKYGNADKQIDTIINKIISEVSD